VRDVTGQDVRTRAPDRREEVGKSGVDIDPLPGAELQSVVDATFVIAPAVLERARKLGPQQ
jgi:hypothetical protein